MFGMFVCLCLCMTLFPGLLISALPDQGWKNYDQSKPGPNFEEQLGCFQNVFHMLLHCCQMPETQEPIVTPAELQNNSTCRRAVFKGQCLRELLNDTNDFLIET